MKLEQYEKFLTSINWEDITTYPNGDKKYIYRTTEFKLTFRPFDEYAFIKFVPFIECNVGRLTIDNNGEYSFSIQSNGIRQDKISILNTAMFFTTCVEFLENNHPIDYDDPNKSIDDFLAQI